MGKDGSHILKALQSVKFPYFLGFAQHKRNGLSIRGLLSPTSTGDVTAALTVAPHSTSVQKGVGVHRAHV